MLFATPHVRNCCLPNRGPLAVTHGRKHSTKAIQGRTVVLFWVPGFECTPHSTVKQCESHAGRFLSFIQATCITAWWCIWCFCNYMSFLRALYKNGNNGSNVAVIILLFFMVRQCSSILEISKKE